ncbi:hypothetical protein [Winogradskyella algicola]|uniref:hypothetical protein n=1 Tax=Winogradskyella algicola TaxID=2575815 RepID=UPI001108F659|nr:hypothetical protein [Winogradskyella algicola]
MAPIKFEEQLKDKLEERSLQPSAESWTKLSERLDAEEKKSRFPWFWWMGIAAAVIITLTVVMQTLGPKNTEQSLPKVVEQDVKDNSNNTEKSNTIEIKSIELASDNNEVEVGSEGQDKKSKTEIINYKPTTKSKVDTQLAVEQKIEENSSKDIVNLKNEQKTIIEEARIDKDAVANAIKDINTKNSNATDREVDSLLKVASKELFKDKLQKEANKTVDAKTLLEDVEDEMGQSFRSKVYEVLKDGYKTVKTAVAQRND